MNRRKVIKTILLTALVLSLATALLLANAQHVGGQPVYYSIGLEGG